MGDFSEMEAGKIIRFNQKMPVRNAVFFVIFMILAVIFGLFLFIFWPEKYFQNQDGYVLLGLYFGGLVFWGVIFTIYSFFKEESFRLDASGFTYRFRMIVTLRRRFVSLGETRFFVLNPVRASFWRKEWKCFVLRTTSEPVIMQEKMSRYAGFSGDWNAGQVQLVNDANRLLASLKGFSVKGRSDNEILELLKGDPEVTLFKESGMKERKSVSAPKTRWGVTRKPGALVFWYGGKKMVSMVRFFTALLLMAIFVGVARLALFFLMQVMEIKPEMLALVYFVFAGGISILVFLALASFFVGIYRRMARYSRWQYFGIKEDMFCWGESLWGYPREGTIKKNRIKEMVIFDDYEMDMIYSPAKGRMNGRLPTYVLAFYREKDQTVTEIGGLTKAEAQWMRDEILTFW
ncbi:MAG: hypothetical protein Q4C96_08430 [Planctomycetia bacterium]|nr:hypothetical protein [Planctomycetia bacterium]